MSRLALLGRDDGGFTLVELLIVVMLLGVVGGMVTRSVIAGYAATSHHQARVLALTDLERAVERLSREVRAADPVVAAADGGNDLTVDTYRGSDRIRYRWAYDAGTGVITQTRSVYAPATASTASSTTTQAMIGDVAQGTTPVFTYLAADGSAVASPSTNSGDIARVAITVIRQVPGRDGIRVQTSVALRNLGEET